MKIEDNDYLKEFVKSNKDAFDTEVPSKNVWKGIANRLELSESSTKSNWMWKAAAILFFCTSGYLSFDKIQENTSVKVVGENEVVSHEEFNTTEAYYVSLISEKREQIYDRTNFAENMEGMYEVDIEQLDAMYHVLKSQYETNPSSDLQEAMTLNLLVRIDILNQQLSEIDGIDIGSEKIIERGV